MYFVRVSPGDIEVGKPVPWDLYGSDRRLLVSRGVVLQTERQLGRLMEGGLLRKGAPGEADAQQGEEAGPSSQPQEVQMDFHEVRLEIGTTLQLQPQGGALHYYVKLVGYSRDEAVLVSYPRVDGKLPPLNEGKSFVVRFFAGRCAYAFPTRICKLTTTPFPHVYLEYPSKVRALILRQSERAPVKLAAKVKDGEGQIHQAAIVDLSIGGASLLAKETIGVWGERIELEFPLPLGNAQEHIKVDGIIRSLHAGGASGEAAMVKHGIQFVDLPHEEELALAAYVYQRLFEDGPAV